MSVPIHAFDTVPIRADLRANRDSGDVILDADGELIVLWSVKRCFGDNYFGDNYLMLVTKLKDRRYRSVTNIQRLSSYIYDANIGRQHRSPTSMKLFRLVSGEFSTSNFK